MRVRVFSLLPYCPAAPPVSYKVPTFEETVIAAVQVYNMVYPAPFHNAFEINLMYTWLEEERSIKGLAALTEGVEQELKKRRELLPVDPSYILRESVSHSEEPEKVAPHTSCVSFRVTTSSTPHLMTCSHLSLLP